MKSPISGPVELQTAFATRPATTQPKTMTAPPQVMKKPRRFEGTVSEKNVYTMGMQEPTPKPAMKRNAAKNARSLANDCGNVNRP